MNQNRFLRIVIFGMLCLLHLDKSAFASWFSFQSNQSTANNLTTVEGELVVSPFDPTPGYSSIPRNVFEGNVYQIKSNGTYLDLNASLPVFRALKELKDGDLVLVTGVVTSTSIQIEGQGQIQKKVDPKTPGMSTQNGPTSGPIKVMVVLVGTEGNSQPLKDKNGNPWTDNTLHEEVQLIQRNFSWIIRNQRQVVVDAMVIHLPNNRSSTSCINYGLRDAALGEASRVRGREILDDYKIAIAVFRAPSPCPHSGMANYGDRSAWGTTIDNGFNYNLQAHELLHLLGAQHAGGVKCNTNNGVAEVSPLFPSFTPNNNSQTEDLYANIGGGCYYGTYNDYSATMGLGTSSFPSQLSSSVFTRNQIISDARVQGQELPIQNISPGSEVVISSHHLSNSALPFGVRLGNQQQGNSMVLELLPNSNLFEFGSPFRGGVRAYIEGNRMAVSVNDQPFSRITTVDSLLSGDVVYDSRTGLGAMVKEVGTDNAKVYAFSENTSSSDSRCGKLPVVTLTTQNQTLALGETLDLDWEVRSTEPSSCPSGTVSLQVDRFVKDTGFDAKLRGSATAGVKSLQPGSTVHLTVRYSLSSSATHVQVGERVPVTASVVRWMYQKRPLVVPVNATVTIASPSGGGGTGGGSGGGGTGACSSSALSIALGNYINQASQYLPACTFSTSNTQLTLTLTGAPQNSGSMVGVNTLVTHQQVANRGDRYLAAHCVSSPSGQVIVLDELSVERNSVSLQNSNFNIPFGQGSLSFLNSWQNWAIQAFVLTEYYTGVGQRCLNIITSNVVSH